ncbi:hypothetical protein [Nitratiruptor sp. YY09-18]|uniref:hypothetical protein n=1 Tax=Nitratiruptor sp. YY09-18 TaxID=2724901 RepID=UPI001916419C|nr:hypothetical protein [Nitratiruptor sp. YY09-18]BCD68628.1 putative serine/threonine protein kinase [Nitratiruptor sp. YY09-18]
MQKIFEGNRGEIYLVDYFGKEAILKKRKIDKPNTLIKEAKILQYLEPLRIAPMVYEVGADYIIMEYLQGLSFKSLLQRNRKVALKDALQICYMLDKAGIYHRELGRYYHFIATKKGLCVIDFERAQWSKSPRNVLQFIGFYMRDVVSLDLIELYKQNKTKALELLYEAIDAL